MGLEAMIGDVTFRDHAVMRRAAIEGSGPVSLGSLVLELVTNGSILQLLTKPGAMSREALAAALDRPEPPDLRRCAPGQWFLVSETPVPPEDIAVKLAGCAHIVDQSHGRARFRLTGPQARQLLAKGTGVDLHPDAFPVGQAVMTLIGHIGVNLARPRADSFELLVLRGFAKSLWHEMEQMGAALA